MDQEKIFNSFFENMVSGAAIYEVKNSGEFGKYIEVNDEICRITGYSKKELRDKEFIDLIDKNDNKKSFNIIAGLINFLILG